MQRPGKKISSLAPLPTDRLVALVRANQLPPATWLILAQTFEMRPDAAAELAARREEVPALPVADAFVSALRRLCWPSRRLPERHREAISAVGKTPFSLARLALEEARSRAWRELDSKPLARLVRWLARLPFKAAEPLAEANLAFRAHAYLALCENAIEPGPATRQQRRAVREMIDFSRRLSSEPENQVTGEALLAIALCCAKCFQNAKAGEALALASKTLERASGEERALLGLVRAWVHGEYAFDPEQAEALINESFGALEEAADPWLTLFLHHNATRLAINHSLGQRPDNKDLLKSSQRHGKTDHERLFWVMSHHLEVPEAAADALLRARCHLEAAAPLFRELASDELRILHLWYWGHCLQLDDPARGLDCLFDAMELAHQKGHRGRVFQISEDSLFLRARLLQLKLPAERYVTLDARGKRMHQLLALQ